MRDIEDIIFNISGNQPNPALPTTTFATAESGLSADVICDRETTAQQIQEVLSASTSIGHNLIFYPGIYYLKQVLTIDTPGIYMSGSTKAVEFIRDFDGTGSSKTDSMIYVTSSGKYFTINSIEIDGNAGTYPAAKNYNIYVVGQYCSIQNCILKSSQADTITVTEHYCQIVNNTVRNSNRSGIVITGPIKNCYIVNNIIEYCLNNCVTLDSAGSSRVLENNIIAFNKVLPADAPTADQNSISIRGTNVGVNMVMGNICTKEIKNPDNRQLVVNNTP